MAENQDNSTPSIGSGGSGSVNTNTFNKGMMKDYNESFVGDGLYTHARNAVNNSHDGQVGVIGNEPSNLFCVDLPYTLIGTIHMTDDQWVMFLTDDTNSEIGIFDESSCTYTALKSPDGNPINFNCLGLKRTNLITGVSRKRFDCDRLVYFDDGLNPTRVLNINTVPVIKNCAIPPGGTCQICTEVITSGKATLDCEAIRIAPLVTHPCITIKRGTVAGTLPNGSYQAAIAYLVNGSRVTDYLGLSTVQGLWTHENTSSSLEITIDSIDQDFEEFELVILSNINAQSVAKKIGTYSTTQGTIYVDRWSTEFITVSVSDIVLRTEPIEKSDATYSVNKYLLRVGSYSKFKFNYQPLANQITTKWVAVEYPADYYVKQNNAAGYMRDEVYSFFIRFVYNTGEYSESYHIPGRPSTAADLVPVTGGDAFEGTLPTWKVYNTATVTSTASSSPAYLNGGEIVATGQMGYWESTERYPGNRSDIWDSFPNTPGNNLNLCGKPIRHHKMPDETRHPKLQLYNNTNNKIVILGVEFDNIKFPVDNNGNPISSIVGYQILRGSREGNKSIIAKGIINNMMAYDIPGNSTVKGLFQNYPYNDLRDDPYLTPVEQTGKNGGTSRDRALSGYQPGISDKIYSFHSPETTFNNPYLNPYDLKLYSEYNGKSVGRFVLSYKHPKFKFPTDAAKIFIDLLSTAIVVAKAAYLTYLAVTAPASAIGVTSGSGVSPILISADEDLPITRQLTINQETPSSWGVFALGTGAITGDPGTFARNTGALIYNTAIEAVMSLLSIPSTSEKFFKILLAFVPKIENALQFVSHGFYDTSTPVRSGNTRRKINKSNYIDPQLQQFGTNYQINNLNRSRFIALEIDQSLLPPVKQDRSRYILGDAVKKEINTNEETDISSYYAGIKLSIPSQYGQLESIKQFPITTCIYTNLNTASIAKTNAIFGGDIYINRFTEKNTMFFFTDWLLGQPDMYEYDYTLYQNIPYARHWINTTEIQKLFSLPSKYRVVDQRVVANNLIFLSPALAIIQLALSIAGIDFNAGISLEKAWFYLFNSGVRDFYVESEVNIAYRDYEDTIPKRHYDVNSFTDLNLMFRSDYINNPNFYKYDYSLSISKLVNSAITWGTMLDRNYDPQVAETCYTYRPDRVLYSLPQNEESRRDTWRVFLANNYRDFSSPVSSIKSINKTGALFMMARQSPIQFTGVEELRMDGTNTKVTIGDGGLFNQELQSVVNVDKSYEYGSNQGRYCAINTTYGLFWVSQNQGKVFQYSSGLNDITNGGLKWWFAKYLPSQLVALYPDYPLADNPIVGVGVQLVYDNTHEILYLVKKDYKPTFTNPATLELRNGKFYLPNTNTVVPLTDTTYFQDASFTASYDPKAKAWISFHDWIPTVVIPAKNHFLTVKDDSIWKHNIRCDSYCNYYGVNYPFEVEFISTTGQVVTSMRSIEYMLEVYNYYNDCRDKFHVLDQNFDQAIVYNSEQVSGNLLLTLKDKTNPFNMLTYPIVNPAAQTITINFAKEENKYRFNQFWDITKDRGEYSGANLQMFNTDPSGYKYNINPAYVNYSKDPLQHKKFRHYVNRVFLKKTVSGKNKMLFKIANEKLLQSPR